MSKKMPKKDSTVKHSLQDGGSSFKPCQTFEKAAFFFSLFKNCLPIHSIKKSAHTYTNVLQPGESHNTHTRLSRLLKCWQMPSDRQAGTVDQSEVNDGEGGGGKRDGGVRDNNQMNDRIQVFGFARQPLGCLHSLQQPMVSDYSSVIGRQSQGARQRLGEMINWRGGREGGRRGPGGERGVWQKVRTSALHKRPSPTFANIWLNFPWDPPSWLFSCIVRGREAGNKRAQ